MSVPVSIALRAVAPESGIHIMVWKDICVVIDDGSGCVSDYDALNDLVVEQAKRFPIGVGCLALIPSNASPPPQDVRAAMNRTLDRGVVRCMCWQVEGRGFQAATVRAVLTGLNLFAHRRFPTHIANSLEEALRWMLPQLAEGEARLVDVHEAQEYIRTQRQRRSLAPVLSEK